MFCIHCGKENQDGVRLCASCGQPLNERTMALTLLPEEDAVQEKASPAAEGLAGDASFCIHCGTEVSLDAVFCPECGQPVNDRTMATVVLAGDGPAQAASGPADDRDGAPADDRPGEDAVPGASCSCLACGADNDPDAVVCAVCGTPFPGHTMDVMDLGRGDGDRSGTREPGAGPQTMGPGPLPADETVEMHPVPGPDATAEMPPVGAAAPEGDTPPLDMLDASGGEAPVDGDAVAGAGGWVPAGAGASSEGARSRVPTPGSTLFCMHCGASNRATSRFCSRCGQRMGTTPSSRMTVSPPVGGGMQEDRVTRPPMTAPVQQREDVGRSYRNVVILLVAILALLVVLSVFLTVDMFM